MEVTCWNLGRNHEIHYIQDDVCIPLTPIHAGYKLFPHPIAQAFSSHLNFTQPLFLPLLPPLLLPLILFLLPPLLPLNLRNKPLILLLIRLISLPLLSQIPNRLYLRIFPQLTNSALAFSFIFFLEFGGFSAVFVGIVVSVGVEGLFEFWDGGFYGERAVVVQFGGSAC